MHAVILDTVDNLDPFVTDSTDIKATSLREGMVIMDPALGTPLLWLDHRVRAARGSGQVAWLAHDLETGRFETHAFHENHRINVLAA
jgi:hypothetical protein